MNTYRCVCIYIYIYIYIHVYISIYIYMNVYVHTYVCMYLSYPSIFLSIFLSFYLSIYLSIYTYIHICESVYVFIYLSIYICVCIYIYIDMYIHMYVSPLLIRMWQRYPMSMVFEWWDESGNTRRIWLGGVDGATDVSKLYQCKIGCRVLCGFGDHAMYSRCPPSQKLQTVVKHNARRHMCMM